MTHDQIIPFLVDKLKKYPDIKFDQKGNAELIIHPRNDKGFGLIVMTNERENMLYFGDAYHWHFDNSEAEQAEMLDQIVFGLTGIARIKVWTKNKKAYKWTLELQDQDGNWSDNGTTGLIKLNFWTQPEFYYLQNDLLPIDKMRADN